eukprot:gene18153-22221_t
MDSHLKLAHEPSAELMEKLGRTAPMQARILEMIRTLGGEATLSQLRRELPRATTLIKPLLKAGHLTRSEVRVERDPFQTEEFLPSQPLTFTDEQQAAFERVMITIHSTVTPPVAGEEVTHAKPLLLHGVTGSGTITNSGTISSSSGTGVYLNNGGTITNSVVAALISGASGGIVIKGAPGSVFNSGTVTSSSG